MSWARTKQKPTWCVDLCPTSSKTPPTTHHHLVSSTKYFVKRFLLPAFDDPDEAVQMSLIKDAAARHGIRAKLSGSEIFREGLSQAPRFLLNMESYPKVGAGSLSG